MALTLLVLAALEIPLAISYADREREQLEASLMRDAFVLAAFIEDSVEHGDALPLDMQQLADSYEERTAARVVIVDRDGALLADSEPPVEGARSFSSRPEIAEALASRVSTGIRPSETLGTDLLYVAVPVASGGQVHGALRLTFSRAELDERVHRYWLTLGGIAVVSLAIAAGAGVLLSRWVVRPVTDLRAAAVRLGGGDLTARASPDGGPPEIRELAEVFNATAAQLEDLIESQEQFVADASHQLRTPLTALRLRLEMLEAELDDPALDGAIVRDDLAGAGAEVERLSRLVDGLLALARADRRSVRNAVEPIDTSEMLVSRAAVWSPLTQERGVTIEVDPAEATAMASPDRLVQVIDNLLANAVDVSPAGGTITLSASSGPDGRVTIHVIDDGPGMTEEQRARAVDRFWRGRVDRTELGGSGLGLAIVDKLVRLDGGELELRDRPGRPGLEAVVRLPGAGQGAER
jgi:signal transduction histidine kinase